MTRVCLGDVAREIKQKAPAGQELPTVGLEHLDPGEVELARWDEDAETTFTKAFSKGQVLFGRRRAYLRKAAVAPFDGVCSGDITVIAAKSNLSPRLLPFIIQNDALFEHAVTNSAGSLSPRVKWQSLSQFEFGLPNIDKQEELADILWAAQSVRRNYRRLLVACDDVVKSQFVEMFGNLLDSRCDWQKETLDKYTPFMTSGSRGWAKYYSDAGSLFITIKNVKDCRLHLDNVQHVQPPQGSEAARTKVQKGDLLVSVTADLGRTAVVDESTAARPAYINQHLMLLRLDTTSFDPFFVAYFMESADGKAQFSKKNMTGVKAGLNFESLRSFRIIKPPLALQQEFAAFAASVDKSKFAVQKALDELNATTKKILDQELGLGDV